MGHWPLWIGLNTSIYILWFYLMTKLYSTCLALYRVPQCGFYQQQLSADTVLVIVVPNTYSTVLAWHCWVPQCGFYQLQLSADTCYSRTYNNTALHTVHIVTVVNRTTIEIVIVLEGKVSYCLKRQSHEIFYLRLFLWNLSGLPTNTSILWSIPTRYSLCSNNVFQWGESYFPKLKFKYITVESKPNWYIC